MSLSYKKHKRLILYGVAAISGFLLLSPFIITWGINTAYIKNKITSFVYHKTGMRIDDSTVSLALFPHAGLAVKKVMLTPDNGMTVTIDLLKFNFDMQQLLQGNIHIDQISIDRPEIKTIQIRENKSSSPLTISASNAIQELKKIVAFLPEHQKSVELKFKNAVTPYFKQMDGSLVVSKETEAIRLNTTIKELKFNSSLLSKAGFETYPDVDSIELKQANLFADINGKGELNGRCTFLDLQLLSKSNRIVLDSNFMESTFKVDEKGYQLVLPLFKLNYPEASIGIRFENSLQEKKTYLQFTGANIHVEPARQMSLGIFKNNELVNTIFQIIRTGFVPDIQLSFQGRDLKNLFSADQLRIKGQIEKGSIAIPRTHLIATDVNADVHMDNGVLVIKAKKAVIQNSTIEKGDLSIDLVNHQDVSFQGDFSLDLDLSQVGPTLISLLPGTLLAKELSLVHDVTGRSKADLSLLLEPDATDLKVTVNAKNLSATGFYDRMPGIIHLENADFHYESERVVLKHLNARINGSKIDNADTLITFTNDAAIKILSGSADIDLASIMPMLLSYHPIRQAFSPVKITRGKMHISSIALSGPLLKPEKWAYALNGKTDGIDITTQNGQKQIQNLSCQYHFSNNQFNLKQIQARVHDLSWLEPLIERKHLDSIAIPFDLENGHFYFSDKNSFFQTQMKFASGPTLYIDLKGETPASFFLNEIRLLDETMSNASILFNVDETKPFIDFKGLLDTISLQKVFRADSFWETKINALTRGQSIVIRTDKDSSLQVTTKTMDLNPFLSQPGIILTKRPVFPDKTIHFKAGQLNIKNFSIVDMNSDIRLQKDTSHIQLNNAFLCDLKTSGDITLEKDSVRMDLPFTATDKRNIQDLITCLFNKSDYLDGQYSLSGNLTTNSTKTDFLNKLNGNLILTVQKGRIYKLTLLSRILSVLNVSKFFKGHIPDITQNGFAYHRISLEARIKDSIIYLTRAVIDGQDMTLIFTGWIDPFKKTMDLTCLVAPFKTIDLIVEKIPIVNTLLNGRLVSVPVKASGDLFDPSVVPLHPSAVGEGLITMMSDILKTPVKLWDKIYGE